MSDDLRFEGARPDDWDDIYHLLSRAFLSEPDDEASASERHNFEPERSVVVRRGDEAVGHAGILTRRMGVPGGTIAAAHVTSVGVDATARRRGILTRLMTQQFDTIRQAGQEPIAVLWASEGRIYQRYGYGLAARKISIGADTGEVRLSVPAAAGGRLRGGSPADFRKELSSVYSRVYPTRSGWSERADRHWEYRLSDPKGDRNGATALRAVVHESPAGVDGYALLRTKSEWGDGGPVGEVRVLEVVTESTEAYLALWHYLFNIDLSRRVNVWCAGPPDEPLQYLVNEPRRLNLRLNDALWVRLVDLPAALAARRYAVPVDLVLDVTDERIPANAGRWRLTGGPDGATCEATTDDADLTLDVRTLAAAYLGDPAFGAQYEAGLIREHTPGAVLAASAAFSWLRLPTSIEIF